MRKTLSRRQSGQFAHLRDLLALSILLDFSRLLFRHLFVPAMAVHNNKELHQQNIPGIEGKSQSFHCKIQRNHRHNSPRNSCDQVCSAVWMYEYGFESRRLVQYPYQRLQDTSDQVVVLPHVDVPKAVPSIGIWWNNLSD